MNAAGVRILVVEDNATLRGGVSFALRATGSDVEEAASAEEAVSRIHDTGREPFDVVLTDLRLPGTDGLAVLRAARERDSRTSVLLMTAFGSIETAVEAMRSGAFDFVQKPVDLEQIELRVARASRCVCSRGTELRARFRRSARPGDRGRQPGVRAPSTSRCAWRDALDGLITGERNGRS